MPKSLELRKVISILRAYGVKFGSRSGGKHSGKFIKGNRSFPVKAHGMKTTVLPYAIDITTLYIITTCLGTGTK